MIKIELTLEEALKIAKIHEQRITEAQERVASMMPLTGKKVAHFSFENLAAWEVLSNRFAKLQDLMAQTIIADFLDEILESKKNMSFIDRLNQLEKLGIIESADNWRDLREIRNHLAHEYPDRYDLVADFLTITYKAIPELLGYLHKIEAELARLPKSK